MIILARVNLFLNYIPTVSNQAQINYSTNYLWLTIMAVLAKVEKW